MTILQELQNADLPVISASEDGAISMGAMTSAQELTFVGIVTRYFLPVEYANSQAQKADRQTLITAYTTMITRLEQIQAATNPTNAQVISAVQDLSLYVERIMKVLKTLVT